MHMPVCADDPPRPSEVTLARRIRRLPPLPSITTTATTITPQARQKPIRLPAPPQHRPTPYTPASLAHLPAASRQHDSAASVHRHANSVPVDSAWWTPLSGRAILNEPNVRPIDLDHLLIGALAHSPRILGIADAPLIQETTIVEAAAAFDPQSFLDTKFRSISDPVGNTLTTGGPSRLMEKNWEMSAGIRKKTERGGTVELTQQLGTLSNNSVFLVPERQGNARFSLSYTHPILRGAGKAYNQSLIVLAELDTRQAAETAVADIQSHLQEVAVAYERLKLHRASLLQKQRLIESGRSVLAELTARQGFDAAESQVARARAAVASREADLARAMTEIKNAQTRLNALVQVPYLFNPQCAEFIPVSSSPPANLGICLEDALVTALHHRTEISRGLARLEAAQVRAAAAANESLPTLDVVLEGYVAGLAPNYQTASAFGDQFTEGQPGFTAGIVLNAPWGARAARSRHRRRQLEQRRIMHQFQQSLATIRGEVEIAVREVKTAEREIDGNYRAMEAAQADIHYLEKRWEKLPRADGARGFLLEDLLKAQERLAKAEYELAASQLRYATSLIELKKTTGTLMNVDTRQRLQARSTELAP